MKAYVLHGVGNLLYEDVPVPELKSGWALVKVLAAGICSSDIPRIFEKGTYRFPTIPGHEFCGVVEKVYDSENESWIGKRVGVYPLIPCKKCASCAKTEYETCGNYDYIGSRRDGAFAEYALVPVWNLIELPDEISDVDGAMLEPASVALHAVRKLGNLSGKSACVVGSGAIGFISGQWLNALGADRVMVKGRSTAKQAIAEQCGLEYVTEAREKFDCIVEAVGSPEAVAESIALAKPGGRLVLMGNPNRDINMKQDVYWQILRKQLIIYGTWNSSFKIEGCDWIESIRAIADGKIRVEHLCTHLLVPSVLARGLDIMRNAKEPYCKIIVRDKSL